VCDVAHEAARRRAGDEGGGPKSVKCWIMIDEVSA
jgi:hypothetical protein